MKMEEKKAFLANAHQLLELRGRIAAAMNIIAEFGGVDGAHHKAWVIDRVARVLMDNQYKSWVADLRSGENGPESYDYDEGIAP